MDELQKLREIAAQRQFENARLSKDELKDLLGFEAWNHDGHILSRPLYWDCPDGESSEQGSFGVSFVTNSDQVTDWWIE